MYLNLFNVSAKQKDEYNRERLCIIKDLYSNIRKFENTNPLRIAEINSFTNKIIDNELILPSNIFEKLIEFSDYYKGIVDNNNRDVRKEAEIKKLLKEYYNEQRN